VGVADAVLEQVLVVPCMSRDIGTRPTHVEADHGVEARASPGPRAARDTTGGPTQQSVLGLERGRVRQAPGAGHDQQIVRAQRSLDPFEIPTQQGRETGVDDRGLGTLQQLDPWGTLRRAGDVPETPVEQEALQLQFMGRVTIGVHQRHSGGTDTRGTQPPGLLLQRGAVQRHEDRTVGGQPFPHLDHRRMKRFGLQHLECEQLGALLGSDREQIAEAPCDEQRRRYPVALQQGVGPQRRGQSHLRGWKRL